MHWVVVKNKSTVVSVVCTCTLCNNDIPHHSGQNLLRIHLAPSHESITFWLLWWQTSLSIGEQTMLNHFRFVKFISFQYFTFQEPTSSLLPWWCLMSLLSPSALYLLCYAQDQFTNLLSWPRLCIHFTTILLIKSYWVNGTHRACTCIRKCISFSREQDLKKDIVNSCI